MSRSYELTVDFHTVCSLTLKPIHRRIKISTDLLGLIVLFSNATDSYWLKVNSGRFTNSHTHLITDGCLHNRRQKISQPKHQMSNSVTSSAPLDLGFRIQEKVFV